MADEITEATTDRRALDKGDGKRIARLARLLAENPGHVPLRTAVDANLSFWEMLAAHDRMLDKNPNAVALGRLGGKATPKKPRGVAALPPERRAEIARNAAKARWGSTRSTK